MNKNILSLLNDIKKLVKKSESEKDVVKKLKKIKALIGYK